MALATPEQLMRIFDLDLWRSAQPGVDEEFDAERFGLWLEVLAEFGASSAAQKLAQIDADLVIAGLAQHARVFDCAVVTPYRTTDGIEMTGIRETGDGLACEVGGYRVVATRTGSWDAIVSILVSLDAEHPEYFHQVMRGCRALSNASFELDGLDDVLGDNDQAMFDVAIGREQRRDKQGYVTPVQARAFLEMSRQIQLGSDTVPPASPIALAYLRLLDRKTKAQARPRDRRDRRRLQLPRILQKRSPPSLMYFSTPGLSRRSLGHCSMDRVIRRRPFTILRRTCSLCSTPTPLLTPDETRNLPIWRTRSWRDVQSRAGH